MIGALGFEPRVSRTRIVNVAVTPCPAYALGLRRGKPASSLRLVGGIGFGPMTSRV